MNAQVKFPFRLCSTLFCCFRVRRRFAVSAFDADSVLLRLRSRNCFITLPFRCVCILFRFVLVDLSSVFRLSFKHSLSVRCMYVQRSFCAGVCAGRKWKRNFLIKGVAFGCTQRGGTLRFRALARTLVGASIQGNTVHKSIVQSNCIHMF